MSSIKDSNLANEGHEEVSWAQRQMQVLEEIKLEFSEKKPLEDLILVLVCTLQKKQQI